MDTLPDEKGLIGTEDGAGRSSGTGRRRRPMVTLLVGAALVALLGWGIWRGIDGRTRAEAELAQTTSTDAVPTVDVVRPTPGAPDQELALPGNTLPYTDTPIYARTNGYLKKWYYDIGAHVKQGDLLAEIETPEIDEQLHQARADLVTAQANLKLAAITAQRNENLVRSQSVSQQERDNAVGAYAADKAIVASRQADVARLEKLQSYERVYAPFDGVITARNTDIGDLINAGAGTPTTQLFHMAATGVLRIYVQVPEPDAPAMVVGAHVGITLDEYPGRVFTGRLVRTSGAIDLASRTLLVEVDVDNPKGELLPGAYVFAHFKMPGSHHTFTIPANALLFRREGLQVGVVRDGQAQLRSIRIGRDYGSRVEVIEGLGADDDVIVNPSDSLIGGTRVRIAPSPAGKAS